MRGKTLIKSKITYRKILFNVLFTFASYFVVKTSLSLSLPTLPSFSHWMLLSLTRSRQHKTILLETFNRLENIWWLTQLPGSCTTLTDFVIFYHLSYFIKLVLSKSRIWLWFAEPVCVYWSEVGKILYQITAGRVTFSYPSNVGHVDMEMIFWSTLFAANWST